MAYARYLKSPSKIQPTYSIVFILIHACAMDQQAHGLGPRIAHEHSAPEAHLQRQQQNNGLGWALQTQSKNQWSAGALHLPGQSWNQKVSPRILSGCNSTTVLGASLAVSQ